LPFAAIFAYGKRVNRVDAKQINPPTTDYFTLKLDYARFTPTTVDKPF
jgi:hypothetical protein